VNSRWQIERRDDLGEKPAAFGHALDQMHPGALATLQQDGQNDTRKSGARAKIGPRPHLRVDPQQLRTVDEVAQPERCERRVADQIHRRVRPREHGAKAFDVGEALRCRADSLGEPRRQVQAIKRRRGVGHGPEAR